VSPTPWSTRSAWSLRRNTPASRVPSCRDDFPDRQRPRRPGGWGNDPAGHLLARTVFRASRDGIAMPMRVSTRSPQRIRVPSMCRFLDRRGGSGFPAG
jgi:hypothetical protein